MKSKVASTLVYYSFDEVAEKLSLNKLKLKARDYLPHGKYPVVDQGQEKIGGYSNDENLLIPNDPPFIVFGDHTKVKKYIDFKFVPGADGVKVLKTKKGVNPKYFYYLLHTIKIDDKGYARHFQFIEKGKFAIVRYEDQLQIVSKLEELFSELDKSIEQLKTAQQQLKLYRQSVLQWAFEGKLCQNQDLQDGRIKQDALITPQSNPENAANPPNPDSDKKELPEGWKWVKLGDHAFVTKLAGFEFTKYVQYKEIGEIPVIRAQNVSKNGFVERNFVFVDHELMEHLTRSRIFGGEILMVFVGAGLGNVGIVPVGREFFLGPNVAKIAVSERFINKFIYYFLSSKMGFGNISGKSKATAQGSISMGNIREVVVPLASLTEQEQIIQEIETRLSVADKLEETISQSLQQAEALRQSILKQAFEGRLI